MAHGLSMPFFPAANLGGAKVFLLQVVLEAFVDVAIHLLRQPLQRRSDNCYGDLMGNGAGATTKTPCSLVLNIKI